MKFLGTLMKISKIPLQMTGPTVANISVPVRGLPALRQIEWVGFTMQRSSCVPNRS
ncbi:hypothetical protein GCD22_03449 [Acidithiobacillus thiooxidans ATCC 19377]|uniref:Uncharacterized protein n=2 Tax=Acidithiobacillus thiooxidans TaxID=930 RepID=A0A5P9XVD9_ACITH|nr:hypothetical protein GCD22_03449 [Acidithiobacillus thiooxidans ATCC 19377]